MAGIKKPEINNYNSNFCSPVSFAESYQGQMRTCSYMNVQNCLQAFG